MGRGATPSRLVVDKPAADRHQSLVSQAALGTPNLENCTRVIADAEIHGKWEDGAKPSEEDCRPFAAQAQAAIDSEKAAFEAQIRHSENMSCSQIGDIPGIDRVEVAALRRYFNCPDGLPAEFRK
jgi:hypothetical protein